MTRVLHNNTRRTKARDDHSHRGYLLFSI